jgi:drug/metabolite transporter (DMT)-like permease
MTPDIFMMVLFAGLMHALWNALVKGASDRTITFGLVSVGHTIPAIIMLPFVPLPDPELLPYIAVSTVIHWGYYYFLNTGYRFGDLSLVYPVARGVAPLLVALPAFIWLDESLPAVAWAGMICISAGILVLAIRRAGKGPQVPALVMALLTGGTIALYSLVDGVGIRLAEQALTYIIWLFIAEGFVILYIFLPRMKRLRAQTGRQVMIGLAGGILSALAYALALYAKSKAPLGMVSALRETSVVFAAMIGLIWFGERPVRPRLIAAAMVAIGIVMLALA